ncbi:FecR family protein [Fibrobacter sp. UWB16]|uniref:FecR domain-containing protein n=1 Tax=Fibrobacter sp. UWB16 TaxID=1945874 RepID=UPI000BD3710B|nr:FecR domain-containing protein [Fibrobacter sp. UWB16]SOD13686.1 FecR family protein [Fibrobacter sp. UWB16]
MFKHLSLSCLLLAMVVPVSVSAAKVGTTRTVIPVAEKSKGSCDDDAKWKSASGKIDSKDCFRTSNEGSIELQLNGDKSILTIEENSTVRIDTLVEQDEDGFFKIKTNIQKGYMGFNVEKKNRVHFSTGTAAASIRGTNGAIGGNQTTMFAGLKNGFLWVSDTLTGDSLVISDGETVIGKGQFAVLKLKSSGDINFAKILNELIADSTLSLEDLKAAAISADSAYQELLAAKASAQTPATEVEDAALKVPQIKYSSYDSLRCVANVTVSDVQKGTEVRVSAVMDGTPISEVSVKRNMPKRLALRSGVHEYEFVVENDAGRNSVKKTLGCYPMKPFSVKVFGKKYEFLPIPPAPPGAEDVIMQTLHFQIRVPEYDPSFLNKVTVRQDGKVILQERLSQIQNLDYQIPVELKRNHKNRFDIEVIHKSGFAVKTTKVYEVGK